MAVVNYFTTKAATVGVKKEVGSNPQELLVMVAQVSIAAADDDGSTYPLFTLPNSFRPVRGTILCDAITGGTDYDIGLYDPASGAVVDKDILLDGQTLATASKALNAIGSVPIADIGNKKTLAELLALTPTTAKAEYDVVLTANTVGTAAGSVVVILEGFAQ
jgi:hypothetical protein